MPNTTKITILPTEDDIRWQAVLTRDSNADGKFYYSVKTTGVYCRPSCPARIAKPENVHFHTSRKEAEAAGLRPCRRCKPDMTFSDYRNGGTNSRIRFALGECALGAILVAASDIGLCAIMLGDHPNRLAEELQNRFPQAELIVGGSEFEQWITQVVDFVEAPAIGLNLPLDLHGTAFQQRVWQALQQIPVGEKVSYTDIALRIGSPKAVRAVAGACAANALAVAIPCHRVVRSDGGLSGYRWGAERKAELLRREREQ